MGLQPPSVVELLANHWFGTPDDGQRAMQHRCARATHAGRRTTGTAAYTGASTLASLHLWLVLLCGESYGESATCLPRVDSYNKADGATGALMVAAGGFLPTDDDSHHPGKGAGLPLVA